MTDEFCVIALDVGGTSVKSALLEAPGRVRCEPITTPINSRGDAEAIWNTLAGITRRHAPEIDKAALAGVAITLIRGFELGQEWPSNKAQGISQDTGGNA